MLFEREKPSFSRMQRSRRLLQPIRISRIAGFARFPCLPLVTQTKIIGVLYPENNLARRVFVPTRMAVLKLLAPSGRARARECAGGLEEREAKIRRLVEANIVGICI